MSVFIDKKTCVGCKRCVEICPGNLIKIDKDGKAYIKRQKDCWGCTSCLKECNTSSIKFFLGADLGGKGSLLSVQNNGDKKIWTVQQTNGEKQSIEINSKESNKY
ncbi:MAG: ferredoxin family protein [Agathobacter sp.]|nr:ferredoxin family protein [Agathobacter sp.]